jgi:ABC-type ATPase with predicted acetyltransferase domain
MQYKETIASKKGKQTLWQCAYCGSVVCSTRGKPVSGCPCCEKTHGWLQQQVPVAMFDRAD